MTVENSDVIDFVTHDPISDSVSLVLVEHRDWGSEGALLPDLQAKLNSYLAYVVDGGLASDYPAQSGKPIQFDLRTVHPLGRRELAFLELARLKHLTPRGIELRWKQYEMDRESDPKS